MPPVVSTNEIDRPPADVFTYATDVSRFPEWQRDVARVELHGPLGVGARFTTVRRIGPVEHRSSQEVTEFDSPRRFAARGIDGPLRADATITVEPLDGGTRSRATFTLDFHGEGLGKLLMPDAVRRMAARAAPRSYANLKELLELELERGTRRGAGTGRPGATSGPAG
jgi:uncharacterized protein YndB with AHSA1/START domain